MVKIDIAFNYIRFNSNYILGKKDEYKKDILFLPKQNYGFFLVRVATDCMLLLDQFMDIVYRKLGDLDVAKPNIYFPVTSSEERFNKRNKDNKLENIEKDSPELYEIIKQNQPFVAGENWLYSQYHIALERHSSPQDVYQDAFKDRLLMFGFQEGEKVTMSMKRSDGVEEFASVRRWGTPDRAPPKIILKSKDEAVQFIDNSITETHKLIEVMIKIFESKL